MKPIVPSTFAVEFDATTKDPAITMMAQATQNASIRCKSRRLRPGPPNQRLPSNSLTHLGISKKSSFELCIAYNSRSKTSTSMQKVAASARSEA